jgi:hypothetical protein
MQLPHILNGRIALQQDHLSFVFSNELPDETHINRPLILLYLRIQTDEQLVERARVAFGRLSRLDNFRTKVD